MWAEPLNRPHNMKCGNIKGHRPNWRPSVLPEIGNQLDQLHVD